MVEPTDLFPPHSPVREALEVAGENSFDLKPGILNLTFPGMPKDIKLASKFDRMVIITNGTTQIQLGTSNPTPEVYGLEVYINPGIGGASPHFLYAITALDLSIYGMPIENDDGQDIAICTYEGASDEEPAFRQAWEVLKQAFDGQEFSQPAK